MPNRRSSGHRSRALSAASVALCIGVAFALLTAGATAQPRGCAKGGTGHGCRLPAGARYFTMLSSHTSISVQVRPKGVSMIAYAVPIKCTRFDPAVGSKAVVEVGLNGSQQPKIGKTYTLKQTESEPGEEGEGSWRSLTEVTLSFKSAFAMKVRIHQLTEQDGKVVCDGAGAWRLKRQA